MTPPTYHQLIHTKRNKRIIKNKRKALHACPQKRTRCVAIRILTPRKPNSAKRKIAVVEKPKIQIKKKIANKIVIKRQRRQRIVAFIPGEGHQLRQFSIVFLRGGRVRDLPGVKYRLIRGGKKNDLKGLDYRRQGRSKYGAKKP